MKNLNCGFAFFSLILLMAGCQAAQKEDLSPVRFKSENYGFSFNYTKEWVPVDRDLPQKFALLDKDKNTVLFLVSKAPSQDLLLLGRSQALSDLFNDGNMTGLKQSDLRKVSSIVRIDSFNEKNWYTYGINFTDKNAVSLISGTLCSQNEIVFVLVSSTASFDMNKDAYTRILNSFEC